MRKRFPISVVALCLTVGCAGRASVTLEPSAKFAGPRELAIIGARQEVEISLEEYLRAKGFRIKRFASTTTVAEATSSRRTEVYNEAATRYGIETHWSLVDRCFGGGFNFADFRLDLLDLRQNEVVFSMRARGLSEHCQPTSGTIFTDVASTLYELWGSDSAAAPRKP